MFPLITLWLDPQRAGARPDRPAPPMHLRDRSWRFRCDCGYRGEVQYADPIWRDGAWRAPRRACTSCHAWIEGTLREHPDDPPRPEQT